ncbi:MULTISPECIES: helix-turn-helix domain-containing protein [unclassified Luteococcus]|uniref:helix-turn-helix domain-containing protein n=1 Tax=unclassified Luteococcus TaxID=2639923 RepID=UPI00313C13A0
MLTIPSSAPIPDGPLHIGDVASLTGLSLRSIRHYEELGLAQPTSRTVGGFRVYDREAVERLRLVMSLKLAGLGLEEMRPIIDACRATETGSDSAEAAELLAQANDRVAEAINQLRERLATGQELQDRLRRAVEASSTVQATRG